MARPNGEDGFAQSICLSQILLQIYCYSLLRSGQIAVVVDVNEDGLDRAAIKLAFSGDDLLGSKIIATTCCFSHPLKPQAFEQ